MNNGGKIHIGINSLRYLFNGKVKKHYLQALEVESWCFIIINETVFLFIY